eukprot:CAMPEP_0119490438 /NCGR_PEP_ID=MMETSP1344-20130328/15604_1 /TAXON_ID=236787 /ORGANISM="Florenciella parvula, Strain CCMP2471" /LENGTH=102 /DNA_ID=CAMNT_0007525587 /DNA_START=200 /DNA_END=505 /DNA_ORIENTATION=+
MKGARHLLGALLVANEASGFTPSSLVLIREGLAQGRGRGVEANGHGTTQPGTGLLAMGSVASADQTSFDSPRLISERVDVASGRIYDLPLLRTPCTELPGFQ